MGNRIDGHSLLRQTKEELAAALGSSAIESEREFIEIVVEVLLTDRSLVGSHQPTFEQGDREVNPRHQLRWSLLLSLEKRDLVLVAFALQGQISQPAVGMDDAARFNRVLHKGHQACSRSVYNVAHPNPTDPGSIFLSGNDNQCLSLIHI